MQKTYLKASELKAPLIVSDVNMMIHEKIFWAGIKQLDDDDRDDESIKIHFSDFYACVTDMGLMDYWGDSYTNWTMDEWVEEYRGNEHYYTSMVQKVLRYGLIHGKLIDGPEGIEFSY